MKMTSTFAFNFFCMACIIVAHCEYDKSQAVMKDSTSCAEFFENCRKYCHSGYGASCAFSYYQATFNTDGTKCTCTGTEPTSSESTDVSKPSVLNIDNFRKSMLTLLAPGGGTLYQEPGFFCIIFEELMVLSPNFVTFPVFILVNW